MLRILGERKGISLKELGSLLICESGSPSRLVERLVRDGLAEKIAHEKDSRYVYEGLVSKGLLTGKSAWVIYTIDSPGWFIRLIRQNVEWTVVKKAILQFCGIRPVKRMMLAGIKGSSARKRKRWLDYVYQQARQLRK
ncbi:MarR family transcriptional regulator [Sporolactobacillus shoreae]|uniref:MarR family transcriptional regulator n=1 Tax=Sporolactobacillus shoreae TaxID=1465501 RepID=A0A4Z0GNP2_9BACL|nr:MarR family transcriptional regulator [Sporolactobacillus shoreae]TGA98699.1 MarR family transcriptional regulator [Sporolactobacillus shoreae]